jgi:hypothetical protein
VVVLTTYRIANRRFGIVVAFCAGISTLGENAAWVRNVKASCGNAGSYMVVVKKLGWKRFPLASVRPS